MFSARDIGIGARFRFSSGTGIAQMRGVALGFGQMDKAANASALSAMRWQRTLRMALAAGAAAMAVGIGGLYTALDLTKKAAAFQWEMEKVRGISKVTLEDFTLLEKEALKLGVETMFTPTAAAQGMYELASAGFQAKQIIESLNPVLDMAIGGELSIEQAALTAVAAMKGFNMEATDMTHIADVLQRGTELTTLKMRMYEQMLGNVSAQAVDSNQSFESTIAMLGALKDTGMTAEAAAMKLRIGLQRLMTPRAQKAAEQYGIVMRNNAGKMLDLTLIIDQLAVLQKRLTAAEFDQLRIRMFGAPSMMLYGVTMRKNFETMQNGEKVVLKGTEAIRAMRKEYETINGTSKEFSKGLQMTAIGRWRMFAGTLETIKMVLGKPYLEKASEYLETITNSLNAWLRTLVADPAKAGRIAELFVKGSLAVVAFGAALTGLILSVKLVTTAIGALTAVSAALPYIAAAAAGIAAAFLYIKAGGIDEIASWINVLWDFGKALVNIPILLKAIITGDMPLFNRAFDTVFGGIKNFVTKFVGQLINAVIDIITLPTKLLNLIPGVNIPVLGHLGFAQEWGNIGKVYEPYGKLNSAHSDQLKGYMDYRRKLLEIPQEVRSVPLVAGEQRDMIWSGLKQHYGAGSGDHSIHVTVPIAVGGESLEKGSREKLAKDIAREIDDLHWRQELRFTGED